MRLPTTLKALKFVLQGHSFGKAKQIVKDRRLAKTLQAQFDAYDPVAVAAQVAADHILAKRVASDGHDPHLMMQDHILAMAEATVQMRAPKSPADAAFWKQAHAWAAKDAYREWSRNSVLAQINQHPLEPMRPARQAPLPTAWEEALARIDVDKAAERKRDLAALQRGRAAYVPNAMARAKPQPRSISLRTLSTPELSLSRPSSVASSVSTPSEPGIMSFWQPAELKPPGPKGPGFPLQDAVFPARECCGPR